MYIKRLVRSHCDIRPGVWNTNKDVYRPLRLLQERAEFVAQLAQTLIIDSLLARHPSSKFRKNIAFGSIIYDC
jgi:hypothetical protein